MARFTLSHQDDWELTHEWQDLRGWPVKDASGALLGTVAAMIADTESEIVEALVLDDGRKISAREVTLDDGVVFVPTLVPLVVEYEDYRGNFLEHCRTTYGVDESGFETYEPAYRFGYDSAAHDDFRDRDFGEAETTLRPYYEREYGEGSYDTARDAIEYGYNSARTEYSTL